MAKEFLLERHAVIGVKLREVFQPVHLQPFLLGGRLHEALRVAPGMQSHAAPVARGKKRHVDFRVIGHALFPVIIHQGVIENVAPEIAPVGSQFLFAQIRGAGNPVAVDATLEAAVALAVLAGDDGLSVPGLGEPAGDAAVVGQVAVEISRPLPDAHGRQVRRLERGHLPLVHPVVGDAVQTHLPVAPGLGARPLDAVVKIPGLARRPNFQIARRAARATRIHAHAGVAVGHPFLGVHELPVLVFVGCAHDGLGIIVHHEAPLVGIAVLQMKPFAVGAVAHDDGVLPIVVWPVYVATQHDAVVHLDRHVPVDPHPVSCLALVLAHVSPFREEVDHRR